MFATDASAAPTQLGRPVTVDMDGDRAVVSSFATDGSAPLHSIVASVDVGRGTSVWLSPSVDPFAVVSELGGRGSNGITVATAEPRSVGLLAAVAVYDAAQARSTITPVPAGCSVVDADVDDGTVAIVGRCFPESVLVTCALPCAPASISSVLVVVPSVFGSPSKAFSVATALSGHRAIVRSVGVAGGGRYRRGRFTTVSALQVLDVDLTAPPRTISIDSGISSVPRMDGNLVVWSIDRFEGARTGTISVYDLGRGRLTRL